MSDDAPASRGVPVGEGERIDSIDVLVFDGWALGRWGKHGIAAQLALVAAVWIAQLIASPLWLRRFRFGPMEWLWRSLTYWKRQPMRIG